MKKNRIYIILFVLLAAIAGYYIYSGSTGTIRKELSDFAINDTAAVDRIFMADRQGKSILLERNAGSWMVNKKFTARQDLVNTLLYTMKSMQVRNPVGKNAYNTVMKLLAANAIKVEIYSNNNIIKTYYVGHPTLDNLGTYMYLEGSSVPFAMFIPGFNGYLTTRFQLDENEWQSKHIFNYNPNSIQKVAVADYDHPDSSLILIKSPDSTFTITNNKAMVVKPVDIAKVAGYITGFGNIYYEKIFENMPAGFRDSLAKAQPFKSVEVTLMGGEVKKVRLYRKKFAGETMLPENEKTTITDRVYDPDRFYLSVEGDKNWYVCQYFQWFKLLKTPDYFIDRSGGRK